MTLRSSSSANRCARFGPLAPVCSQLAIFCQATSVKKSDFQKIEYMVRKGNKQLKQLQDPNVKSVGIRH
jgi:hypothetical protein